MRRIVFLISVLPLLFAQAARAESVAQIFEHFGILGTWAIVVNGTFFAAMSLRTRSREIMLPLLLFPITLPALISTVEATTTILVGDPSSSAKFWIVLLATYDVVFTVASLFLFETVLHAE